MSSLEKCLFRSFSHFFGLFVFLVLSCMSCLSILEINPLSVVSFALIYSHSDLFTLFVVSFAVQKIFAFIQFSSVTQSCLTLRPHGLQHARPACPSPTPGVHSNTSIESVMPSTLLILCHPLLPPSFFPASGSSNESALRIRWSKYWNFSFNISPFNEHSGLISFRMGWLDLLEVQGNG